MLCTKCGAELAPFANECVSCATPTLIVPSLSKSTRPIAGTAKQDISWLSFTLIGLPFLLITAVRTYAIYPGDDPRAQGVIVCGAVIAACIALLICRIFHTRFRLTWAISYAVVVALSVAGLLVAQSQLLPCLGRALCQ